MKIAFLFYQGMTAFDVIVPHDILCNLPGAIIQRVAQSAGPIQTDTGLIMNAEYSLNDISHADILLVPGARNATTLQKYPEILTWLQTIHQTTIWTTSVCTGSLILAAAGLLKGLPATSHWSAVDRLSKWGAIPTQKRVVETGKIITAAGVSAGIDMALTLAAKISGQHVAETIQLGIEYDPQPPFDAGSPSKANPMILEALRSRMTAGFEAVD